MEAAKETEFGTKVA